MIIKSPIKWAGGKSFLLPDILQDLTLINPKYFIEPFCGSAILSLNTPNSITPISNDINHSLINFYKQLQVHKNNLILYSAYSLTELEYYEIRSEFNKLKLEIDSDKVKLAQCFYYLNKAGFNGLYRENSKGEFNVPWGKRKTLAVINTDNDFYEALRRVQFTSIDYKSIEVPPDSLLYLDPPYDTEFTKYNKNDFTWDNQVELLEWAISLNTPFIISNQATKRIVDLYNQKGLVVRLINAPRRIAANGNRDNATEVYAKNF